MHRAKFVQLIASMVAVIPASSFSAQADQSGLVPNTAISGPVLTFDWPGVEVGIGSYEEGPTGLTVIRFANRALGAVDVRGGAPGTVNTDGLRLGYNFPTVDAIVIAGGSSYGEEAITAVQTGLKDDGIRSGANIAVVPGAIINDFGGRRLNDIYPDKRLAQAALRTLKQGVFPLGAQGAGRMAMQGGYFGCLAHSGQGGAFRRIGAIKIAAFVVVNANGVITDRDGNLVKCNRAKSWGALAKASDLLQHLPESQSPEWNGSGAPSIPTQNTTISVIVTNRKLSSDALQRMAVQVHTSMARAIQPFSSQADGDTLFAISTEEVENTNLSAANLDTIAGETMWDAILASVPNEEVFLPHSGVAVPSDRLTAYTGTYAFSPSSRLAVQSDGGKLSILSAGYGSVFEFGTNPVSVLPATDSEFYVDGRYHTRIVFNKDGTGRVTGATLNPGRWEQSGTKISSSLETLFPKEVSVDPKILDRYAGRFQLAPNFFLTITRSGNQLFAQATGQPQFEIFPASEKEFFYKIVDAQITFKPDGQGQVRELILHQNGRDAPGKRVD